MLMMLMIPIVQGIEECKEITPSKDVPCMIITSYNYPNNCTTYSMNIYDSIPTLLDSRNLTDYGLTGKCNTTFNYTEQGSYTFSISSGDTGSIIVEESDNMELAIIITLISFIGVCAFGMSKSEEDYVKLPLLLLISISISVLLNVLQNLAVANGIIASVTNVIGTLYIISLTLLFALSLFSLYALTIALKIKKNPPPEIGSPLYWKKQEKKEKNRKKWR